MQYTVSIDWKKEFLGEQGEVFVRIFEHLFPLYIGKLYQRIEGQGKFGYLPDLARASRFKVVALPAQSFCERVISAANIVMNDGDTLLCDEELDMLVVLRMNRKFMNKARAKFAHLDVGEFKTCKIPENENVEDDNAPYTFSSIYGRLHQDSDYSFTSPLSKLLVYLYFTFTTSHVE